MYPNGLTTLTVQTTNPSVPPRIRAHTGAARLRTPISGFEFPQGALFTLVKAIKPSDFGVCCPSCECVQSLVRRRVCDSKGTSHLEFQFMCGNGFEGRVLKNHLSLPP